MKPLIQDLKEKKLAGQRTKMSLLNNKTAELWKSFLPRRKEITGKLTSDLFSLQIYDTSYFDNFDPGKVFEKWALVEVSDFKNIPDKMESFLLSGGKYAVFHYKGLSNDSSIFEYIFSTWLPASDYELDMRPHFEILGENYSNNNPNSEEEIWIPIKKKNSRLEI
ncbi:AraC family transcriptional regulator [Ancylomarina salipaludis]|uniref:AraC family transcriptional regulator n=1 Tax=Ancylomarina salipaludis TaxID=2501299 RepID=A0A4Q1JNN3_9BACT|nr:AraC family transcriptional regulator [Ancylomarina salipaludis]